MSNMIIVTSPSFSLPNTTMPHLNIDVVLHMIEAMKFVLFLSLYVECKIEKVPRGIRGEKSSKDMASSRNLVSAIGALASPKMGTEPGVRKGKRSLLACHTCCKCSIETSQFGKIRQMYPYFLRLVFVFSVVCYIKLYLYISFN